MKNRIDILNLGVSYDRNIYPATDLRQRKRLPDDMVRCGSCGEVVWESNSYTFHKNGTNDDIIICDNCNEWGHDGYVSCHTCSIPCWVKADKLAEIVGSRNENYVCKEWMECYEYCEGCDVYYNSDHEVCPRCGE